MSVPAVADHCHHPNRSSSSSISSSAVAAVFTSVSGCLRCVSQLLIRTKETSRLTDQVVSLSELHSFHFCSSLRDGGGKLRKRIDNCFFFGAQVLILSRRMYCNLRCEVGVNGGCRRRSRRGDARRWSDTEPTSTKSEKQIC